MVVVVVVVAGRSWQATAFGLLYRPYFERSNLPPSDAPAPTDAFRTPAAEVETTNVPTLATRCPHACRRVLHSGGGGQNYYCYERE
jgi:hypothetical protein